MRACQPQGIRFHSNAKLSLVLAKREASSTSTEMSCGLNTVLTITEVGLANETSGTLHVALTIAAAILLGPIALFSLSVGCSKDGLANAPLRLPLHPHP